MKKIIFAKDIKKFVKKIELLFLNKMWCKWSWLGLSNFFLFFKRIKLIAKNSKTKIDTDHASKMGWAILFLPKYIKTNETKNPINKLPPSPKNILGSLKNEKLKNKKKPIGINVIIKNNCKFLSGVKKYSIEKDEIAAKLNVPSIPSK